MVLFKFEEEQEWSVKDEVICEGSAEEVQTSSLVWVCFEFHVEMLSEENV